MARLTGPPPFVGTKFGVTIYPMYGEYYMRTATSLDAKRVKTDPAFRPLMQYAAYLSCASRIAAEVYKLLPDKTRKHPLYKIMVGKVMQSLKQGKQPEEAGQLLLIEYVLPKKKTSKTNSITTGSGLQVTSAQPQFKGFSFAGEYYTMPDLNRLLSYPQHVRRKRKRAPKGSVLAFLAREH